MEAEYLMRWAVRPALEILSDGGLPNDPRAAVMVLAIALQESDGTERRQAEGGPARSFWQFEPISIREVMQNKRTASRARSLCARMQVAFDPLAVHAAVEHCDILAAGFARLLLLADLGPLPLGRQDAWSVYLRTWKPGRPRPERWRASWEGAVAQLQRWTAQPAVAGQ